MPRGNARDGKVSPEHGKSVIDGHGPRATNGPFQRCVTRRKLLVRGTGLAGAALAGLYVRPSMKSVGMPVAYAAGTPPPEPCLSNSPPTVTVIRPNGGEVWYVGQTQAIKWTADDADGVSPSTPLIVTILYDNGKSLPRTYPYVIASGIVQDSPGLHSYNWTIPAHPYLYSSKSMIRIVVEDVCGAVAADESDDIFCPPAPAV